MMLLGFLFMGFSHHPPYSLGGMTALLFDKTLTIKDKWVFFCQYVVPCIDNSARAHSSPEANNFTEGKKRDKTSFLWAAG
jgi:hypothetical protein